MYEFDEDTAVERIDAGTYRARVTDRWSIGQVPNGGYVLAIATRALARAVEAPDPMAVTAHFVRPAQAGSADVMVEIVKLGKSFTTARARLVQAGTERLAVLATFGDLARSAGPTHIDARPPDIPPDDDPSRERPLDNLPEIARRFEMQLAPDSLRFMRGERSEHAEIRGRVRFADGRPSDVGSLLLFADAMPPPVFHVMTPGWVPTLELGVHIRARPVPGWLSAVFRTRFLFGGLLEEDGELWDESGQLVALSRQLATVPRSV